MSDENNKNLLEINNEKEVEEFKKLKGELAAYKTFDNIYDAFNHVDKMYKLGMMYYKGEGTVKDLSEARKWFVASTNVRDILNSTILNSTIMGCQKVNGSSLGYLELAKMTENEKNIELAETYYKDAIDNHWLYTIKDPHYPQDGTPEYELACFYIRINKVENKSRVIELLKNASDKNNALAHYELAKCYFDGIFCPKSLEEAFERFKESVKLAYLPAFYDLGMMYYLGMGCTQSYEDAYKFFLEASNKKHSKSQIMLANLYKNGLGVAKNYLSAIEWYKRAIEVLDPSFLNKKDYIDNRYAPYFTLKGIKYIIIECYYELALESNEKNAINYLLQALDYEKEGKNNSLLVELFTKIKKELSAKYYNYSLNLTSEEKIKYLKFAIESGNEKALKELQNYYYNLGNEATGKDAIEWYKLAADLDHYDSQYKLGEIYYDGEIVDKSLDKSAKYYKLALNHPNGANNWTFKWDYIAAKEGNVDLQVKVAWCYEYGLGVKESIEEAIKWYDKAFKSGNDIAKKRLIEIYYKLAKSYSKGWLTSPKCVKYLTLAAELNHVYSQYLLGYKYLVGEYVIKSFIKAKKWLVLAAENDDAQSQYLLGISYFEDGKNKMVLSLEDAIKWLIKSANNKYKEAMKKLAWCYENGVGVTKSKEEAQKLYKEIENLK